MTLPPLPAADVLAELCTVVANRERVQPVAVEKDFHLTRLIWSLGDHFGDQLLLKGGTLLSKVDLAHHRMSEDVDLVFPGAGRPSHKANNARALNRVRDALKALETRLGVRRRFPGGELSDQNRHAVWELLYASNFGPQRIVVEVSIRPVLRPPRKVSLKQLLDAPEAGDSTNAFCWALDAAEARAEKVRAACTREAGRDFYDLALLLEGGADLSSAGFIELVDQKLAELDHPPLRALDGPFGLDAQRRLAVEASLKRELPAVVRVGAPPLDLGALLERFAALWKLPRR